MWAAVLSMPTRHPGVPGPRREGMPPSARSDHLHAANPKTRRTSAGLVAPLSTAEIARRQRVTMPACTANGSNTVVSALANTARPNSTDDHEYMVPAGFNASISTSRIRPR